MPVALRYLLTITASVCFCGTLSAQDAQPIDAGYEDISPLQTSLRALPMVMRHDNAFEHVYQSPLDPNQRYRVAGGVYAVFNESEYVATRYGVVSLYPAGVEFHIGPPPGFEGNEIHDPSLLAFRRDTDPRSLSQPDLTAMDRRSEPRRYQNQRAMPDLVLPTTDTTISSEPVRQQRLREIAARAIREAAPGD